MPDANRARINDALNEVCAAVGADGRTSAQLLQAADAAMYSAKRTGGHQVECLSGQHVSVSTAAAPAAGYKGQTRARPSSASNRWIFSIGTHMSI